MSTLLLTLIVSFVLVILCLAMLGISALLTGKPRFRLGMCGKVPGKKKNEKEGCGTERSCGLCGKGPTEKEDLDDKV